MENNSELGNIKIKYFKPIFTGVPGKKLYADYKDCYVHTNYTNHYSHSGSATFVRIYTEYPDAWNQSLIQDDTGVLWECYTNGYINVQVDDTVIPNMVEITPGNLTLNLQLTIVEIGVQVGPGYVVL